MRKVRFGVRDEGMVGTEMPTVVFAARTSARPRETPINFLKFGLSRRLFPIKKTNTSIGSIVEA